MYDHYPLGTRDRGRGANRNFDQVFIIAAICVYAKGYRSIHTISGVYALEYTAYTAASPMPLGELGEPLGELGEPLDELGEPLDLTYFTH